ncbi:MAG: DNA polymerase III subunit gamma/tau [Deltaproteobacteria bacterium]|nr:DNA polymerase III subunit gamma/tau [Deltaproteobacteria bacterium]
MGKHHDEDSMCVVLARKYRPKNLEEIVGQDVVVRILKNAILMNRIPDVFLLSGPMGVGKTSTARVIAKSLNCEKGPTINPCEVCKSCKEIGEGKSVDVIEIDGASNRKVEEARKIIESMKYPPLSSPYKIYIVDEVHMLTLEAFNALLKTIEEPPLYVKFVFATTRAEKLPPTVLSRCVVLDFKKIPESLVKEHILNICKKEKVKIEEEGATLIASLCEGSLRNAEMLLDRAISYCGNNISLSCIKKSLYVLGERDIQAFLETIIDGNIEKTEKWLKQIENEGIDIFYLFNMILHVVEMYVREKKCPIEQIVGVMDVFYRAFMDMRSGIDGEVALKTAAYKACMVKNLVRIEDVLQGIKTMDVVSEQKIEVERRIEKEMMQAKKDLQIAENPIVEYILKEFEGKIVRRI